MSALCLNPRNPANGTTGSEGITLHATEGFTPFVLTKNSNEVKLTCHCGQPSCRDTKP